MDPCGPLWTPVGPCGPSAQSEERLLSLPSSIYRVWTGSSSSPLHASRGSLTENTALRICSGECATFCSISGSTGGENKDNPQNNNQNIQAIRLFFLSLQKAKRVQRKKVSNKNQSVPGEHHTCKSKMHMCTFGRSVQEVVQLYNL